MSMLASVLPPTGAEILEAFEIRIGELHRVGMGWESTGWADNVWFVKVWRDLPPANLALLEHLRPAAPVPVPHPTIDGEWSAQTAEGRHYGVFEFFRGRHATNDDWHEAARLLRSIHDHPRIDLPDVTVQEAAVAQLRDRLDHPWISDRRREVEEHLDRLEAVIEEAERHVPEGVLLHGDYGGWNLLIDQAGTASAILDWDYACIGPREHDVWVAFEHADPPAFLRAYGAADLDRTHLEYALLRRAVQDLAARVVDETDREGLEPWGFARWRRLDTDLDRAAPFLAS